MGVLLGLLTIIGFIVCYIVGRATMSALGIIMFDTVVGLVIKPIIFGFFVIFIGICIICVLFRLLFFIIGGMFSLLLMLLPFAVIGGLITLIIKLVRNKK